MLAYHMLSPASSIEEAGLMTYLQSPLMQACQCLKQLLDCRIRHVQEEDWSRLVEDYHSPAKTDSKLREPKKASTGGGKGKSGKSGPRQEKRRQQCIPFYRGMCKKGDRCNYEHQVDSDGKLIPGGPKSSRSMMKLSRDSMIIRRKQRLCQHLREVLGLQPQ